ncbi:hypothetical protein T265_15396, partial [Opisthorchis viverrini]
KQPEKEQTTLNALKGAVGDRTVKTRTSSTNCPSYWSGVRVNGKNVHSTPCATHKGAISTQGAHSSKKTQVTDRDLRNSQFNNSCCNNNNYYYIVIRSSTLKNFQAHVCVTARMGDTWQLFALLATLCSITESSKVVVLTRENITSFRHRNPLFMLLFSVDWCTHCIDMWPEYELAAEELVKHSPPIPLAKVNGMTEESLVKDFNVNSYPSIFIMSREIVHTYKGLYRAK